MPDRPRQDEGCPAGAPVFMVFMVEKNKPKRIKLAPVALNPYTMQKNRVSTMQNKFSELSNRVIGCAIEVHRHLGPGLMESAYQQCLAHELHINHVTFKMEVPLPVHYKDVQLDCGYRLDFVIEQQIILELKSVDQLRPIHEAQLLTYLKLSGIKQGFLINFNVIRLKEGLQSLVL